MKEVSVMSILLIFLAMFFAALTVWAGRRLHRLLNPRAHVTELQRGFIGSRIGDWRGRIASIE